MGELKFKTNIKCEGCLSKVTPFLNQENGIEKWEIDLSSNDRILSIDSKLENVDNIINIVNRAGYSAEEI